MVLTETYKLLDIICTTPMSTAECERCLSIIKRIQTFLRSTMSEDRLNALAVLSIKKKLIQSILDFDNKVIGVFSSMKNSKSSYRRAQFNRYFEVIPTKTFIVHPKMIFADLYAKTASLQKNDAALYLEEYSHLLRWKNYKENILDVGCGDGFVTKAVLYPHVKDHLEKLEAVDLVGEMIEYARSTNSLNKISYRQMNFEKDEDFANFPTKFDHIFSFYCVHWILDQKALFKKFYNVLNPGGQIFITLGCDSGFHRTLKKHLGEDPWSKYIPNLIALADYTDQPEEYVRKLAEQSGFTVELCTSEDRTSPLQDYEGFIRSMLKMYRFTNYIPEEFREKYIQHHIEATREFCIYDKETGIYTMTYKCLVLVATKEYSDLLKK